MTTHCTTPDCNRQTLRGRRLCDKCRSRMHRHPIDIPMQQAREGREALRALNDAIRSRA